MNYISNHPLNRSLGGWDAVSASIHQVLAEHFQLKFVGPVNPVNDYRARLVSKLRRSAGLAGTFPFFSPERLRNIARAVESGADKSADCDFFHGPTPWIKYCSPRPYFVYLDTCFSTYIDTYHDRRQFLEKDLQRICRAEALWLSAAAAVFFGTRWALDQAVHDYSISARNLFAVGAAGSIAIPEKDVYVGGKNFLFVAYDFERKGGRVCAAAFKEVRARFPEARLTIVGGRPPAEIVETAGIDYVGFLRKSQPAEMSKLAQLYASSFALIHPTTSDIQPLVICEAGYHGCPAIATNSFGIPELVVDGVTGFLIEAPPTADGLAARMLKLCDEPDVYLKMRQAARAHSTGTLTWDRVGSRIAAEMKSALTAQSAVAGVIGSSR